MTILAALVVGVLAYVVMPDGPWYREVAAFALAAASSELFDRWLSQWRRG